MPAFNREPGWLRTCGNMRVRPGGHLEMRGGLVRPRPTGGTAVDPTAVANSGYFGAISSAAPFGWVRVFTNSGGPGTFVLNGAGNLALKSWWIFRIAQVGDYLLIGSDTPFSSVTLTLAGTGGFAGAATLTYKYGTADGGPPTYSNLTTTSVFDFVTAVPNGGRQTTASWAVNSNWVPTTEGNATDGYSFKYFVKIEVTAFVAGGDIQMGHENTHADWAGMNELYVAHGAPVTAANNGAIKLYTHNVTSANWYTVGSALHSGNHPRYKFASYHGVLYMVNGIDQKRWDGGTLSNIGLPAPTIAFTVADGGAGPGTWTGLGAALQFRYAFTYGYGSQQVAVPRDLSAQHGRTFSPTLFGESPPGAQSNIAYPLGGNRITIADANQVNISFPVAPPANVDAIYVYRTDDLTNVPASMVDSMPYFLIFTIYRNNAGVFATAPTFYLDQRLDYPTPQKELDRTDSTPPPRCKNIWVHKNRLFMANSDRFPGRVWWSKNAYVLDAFDQDGFIFEDFGTTEGGRIMAGGEYLNQAVVLTEDQLYGIADVDSDAFQSYPIAPVGCVAPDTFAVKDGIAMWLARDGIYRMKDGQLPVKVSKAMDRTFSRMSYEQHGWSKGVIHNGQYELWLIKPNTSPPTDGWRYDILMEEENEGIGTWSSVGYSPTALVVPLATVTAPLGTDDAGVRHPLLAPMALGANGSFRVYLGELGVLDDAAVIGVTVDIHYGPSGFRYFAIDRVIFYYDADDGWDDPAVSAPTALELGRAIDNTSFGAPTPVVASDYRMIQSIFKPRNHSGTGDVVIRFTANSVGGGTLWGQRLLASYLKGRYIEPLRTP